MVILKARFDGKVLVPDEPLDLAPNQRVTITVEPEQTPANNSDTTGGRPRRLLGQQPGVFGPIAADFDHPLPDSFWLDENDKD